MKFKIYSFVKRDPTLLLLYFKWLYFNTNKATFSTRLIVVVYYTLFVQF